MREHKFRVWDKKRKEWLYDTEHAISLFGETIILGAFPQRKDGSHVKLSEFNDLVAMQYIGLKDKNGKEIFESDIIKCKYGKAIIESIEDIHQSLGWRDKKEHSKCSDIGRTIEKFKNEIEIVGNIYENNKTKEGK